MPSAAPQRLVLPDLAATHRLAQAVAAHARRGDAILLEGELGAGKSAFARAFLRAAAVDAALEVPSPTFTLVQSYETRLGTVHHYDLWRLDGPAALAELGWDEARDDIVLVEWPDRLGGLRPADALTLHLALGEGEMRTVEISGWTGRLPIITGTGTETAIDTQTRDRHRTDHDDAAQGRARPTTDPLAPTIRDAPMIRDGQMTRDAPVTRDAPMTRDANNATTPDARAPRDAVIARFLAAHGYAADHTRPLAQDADLRRYLRLTGAARSAGQPSTQPGVQSDPQPSTQPGVQPDPQPSTQPGSRPALLMDTVPAQVPPFLHVAAHLAAIGLSAPKIIAADPQAGLVLEEDLGDAMFPAVFAATGMDVLFDAAVDTLVALQQAPPPPGLPSWGPIEMRTTALGTLFDWWWPAMFGAPAPQAARDDVGAALATMLALLDDGPHGFVHRDWFVGNLLWLPDRSGVRRVGVIDFQDAAIGHPAYDLVSLLQDARRGFPPGLEDRAIARYLAARPELDPAAFRVAYDACAAQRHLRVSCQWVRLALRDHRPHYLTYGPRTWGLLQAALGRPAAASLANALDRWIPPASRGNPPGLAA